MTQEDVIVLWKDANGWDVSGYKNTLEDLERFAKLVAKHTLMNIDPSKFISCQEVMEAARLVERDACIELRNMLHPIDGHGRKEMIDAMNRGLDEYQAAIRARGEA